MSGKRNIQSIANVGLAWGLREIRAVTPFIKDQVKIVFMKLENIKPETIKRIVSSLASNTSSNVNFSRTDPVSKKLAELFKDFDIEPEYEQGIFVACGGKGKINPQLQNNAVEFINAEQIASSVSTDEENYVVFIDQDVKQALLDALPKAPENDPEEIIDLEALEAKAPEQRDPKERFALLVASTRKLRSQIENYTREQDPSLRSRYLQKIDKCLEIHSLSLIRAEESYNECKDDQLAEKEALVKKLETVQQNQKALMDEMDQRENDHKAELESKDKKQNELQTELNHLTNLKLEGEDQREARAENEQKIQQLQDNIQNLEKEIDFMTEDFEQKNEKAKTSIRDLEDEKSQLSMNLDKKERALKRLETLYDKMREVGTNVQEELEKNNVTPGKIFESIDESEKAAQHTIQLNKRTTFQDKPSLIKPRGPIFDPDQVINQVEDDSQAFYMGANGMIDRSSNTPIRSPVRPTSSRPVICKPANFGLNTWNPLTTDIYVHLDKALKAGREALNVGATHTSVTRMILNSLGSNCDHIENFIEDADKMSLEKFSEAIGKILGKKSSVQMQSFLTAQRRSGEDLLAYFTRLQMLYRSSNKLAENSGWEEDPTHSMSFYSKIYDACYQTQKTELIRKTEELLEKGNLTLPKLKGILIDVNKIDMSKLSAEEPVVAYVNDKSTYKTEKFAQKNKAWYEDETSKDNSEKKNDVKKYDNRRKIVCWHCNTPGHTKLQCFKYIRKLKEEENKGNQRETKTRGSRQREGNPQHQ